MKKRMLLLFMSLFVLAPALFGVSVQGAQNTNADTQPEKKECALVEAARKAQSAIADNNSAVSAVTKGGQQAH